MAAAGDRRNGTAHVGQVPTGRAPAGAMPTGMAAAGAGRPGTVTPASTERQREGAGQRDPAPSVTRATSSDDLIGQRIVVRAYHPSDTPAVWDGIEESRPS